MGGEVISGDIDKLAPRAQIRDLYRQNLAGERILQG
jgi:hypothetical protein